jgi:hypothetical protein
MLTTRFKIKSLAGSFVVLLGALAYVLSLASVAAAGYGDSAHGNTTDGVNRNGAGYTQGDCTHCHDTFNPAICGDENLQAMLFAELDDPDFCMKCHTDTDSVQVGGVPAAAGDVAGIFADVYADTDYGHNVLAYSDLHQFSPSEETRDYLSANKHVECNDCHNPHMADSGLHSSNEVHVSASGNEISGTPINSAFGVEPDWNNTWQVNQSWTVGGADDWPSTTSPATKEYQICFKCHSDYVPWDDGETGSASWTNLALEFNPRKQSYHPVVQALPEIDPGYSGGSDTWGSNRLPPAFTSVVIGDSGFKTGGSTSSIIDSSKNWGTNKWVNWGVRFGTLTTMYNDPSYDYVRNITANGNNNLTVNSGTSINLKSNYSVYSIEYYAGCGATLTSLSGGRYRLTHAIKDFNKYVDLIGYTVVVQEDTTYWLAGNVDWVANGTVDFVDPAGAYVEVSGLTASKGSVQTGTVDYYFSATGQTLMCSDCHSNDAISTTAAQGPHGSAVKWMLKGRNKAWPAASAASNGAGYDGTELFAVHYWGASGEPPQERRYVHDGTDDGLFCLNCHSTVSFSKGTDGLQAVVGRRVGGPGVNQHLSHNAQCVVCHVMVPHGSKLSRLIGDGDGDLSGQMPARYAFNNNVNNLNLSYYQGKMFNTDGTAKGPEAYPEAGSEGGTHGNGICVHMCHHYVPEEWP